MTMKTKYDGLLREVFYDEMHGTKEMTYDTKYGHELRQKKQPSSILIRVLENNKNNYVEEEAIECPSLLVLQQTVEMERRKKNETSGSRFIYFHPKHDFEVTCTYYKWITDAEVLKSY